jgi:hypothetical protein
MDAYGHCIVDTIQHQIANSDASILTEILLGDPKSSNHFDESLGDNVDRNPQSLMGPDPFEDSVPPSLAGNLQQERLNASCPEATIAGACLAVPMLAWNVVLAYVAVNLAPLGLPAELMLFPVEIATVEVDLIIAQLLAQSVKRDCSDIDIRVIPPYEFGGSYP